VTDRPSEQEIGEAILFDHASRKQFALLQTRRFLPLFLTQFLGAFNDNLFKTALTVVIVYGLGSANANLLTNLAAGLFILPFFLFSAAAGQLADKFDKSRIIRYTKMAEVAIMAFGFVAWSLGNATLLFVALLFMGTQSAFFGPSKYAILPQHLDETELVGGNAQLEMSTFVAILIGTIVGGLLSSADTSQLVGPVVVTIACLGLITSWRIPRAPAAAPELTIDWNPMRATRDMFRVARDHHYRVLLSIMGISWFWLLGSAYLTQIPNYVASYLHGGPSVATLLLGSFTAGIGLGALLCDRMSGHKIEIGLVPFGALGISLFGIHLSTHTIAEPTVPYDIAAFIAAGGLPVVIDIIGLTLFGGFFIVPLYAFVQQDSPPEQRARMIALNNIINAVFMVVAALFGAVMLQVSGVSIPALFLTLAIMNIVVSLFVFQQVPLFAARFFVWLLSHSIYRVRHEGLEHIPDEGPALLTCNHVSFVDTLLLTGAIRRPIRFIMTKRIFDIPGLNFIFRTVRAIPILPKAEDAAAYEAAFDEIDHALEKGELVCIFPEGTLTTHGEINEFKPGVQKILARRSVKVVPMALRGLWGSLFSAEGGFFKGGPKRLFGRIDVVAGSAIDPADVSPEHLEDQIRALRGDRR
jgi:1-acyl-sn-glycerol-3-phosphate acyltransferase